MMHITFFFKDIEGIDLSDDVFIPDAELDDSMKDVILKNRSTLQYTPKNVQIMKKIIKKLMYCNVIYHNISY